ncbi:MAG: ROK family protein [Deltaproteobacteria bacterium]|nr:ROK family protein [Deltaproteobacteria bacterium]
MTRPLSVTVAAVDLGGTAIKAGLFDGHGHALAEKRVPTGDDLRAEAIADAIVSVVRDVCGTHATAGLGIGVPGGVYADGRTVSQAPQFPLWKDVDLASMLEERLACPVALDNDANLAALGESWLGAGRGVQNLAMYTLGTGIGGGLILAGRVWRGAWGMAGELGHVTIDRDGPLCGCGNRGCLESQANLKAVVARGEDALNHGRSPILREISRDRLDPVTPEAIYDAATRGCATCREIFEDVGSFLGIAAAGLLNVLNVETILVGGGMSGAWEFIEDSLRREIRSRAFRVPAEMVVVRRAELGNRAGLVGAARMALLDTA